MSKNLRVEDIKPSNLAVLDVKPSNSLVVDAKPKNLAISTEVDRLYTQVLTEGMYMGIPPFTYPEAGTIESPFSP